MANELKSIVTNAIKSLEKGEFLEIFTTAIICTTIFCLMGFGVLALKIHTDSQLETQKLQQIPQILAPKNPQQEHQNGA